MQLEAVVEAVHPFGTRPEKTPTALGFEVRVERAHVEESLLVPGVPDGIDPDRWRPLLMSFGQFYGMGARAGVSALAEIPEERYRPAARMGR